MLLFIILINLVSGIAILVPAKDIIWDPYSRGISRIKREGVVLVVAVLILIGSSPILYLKQEDIESKRSGRLKADYDSSLGVIKRQFDSSNRATDSLISDNLGKYGFKFDSTSSALRKIIQDSTKVKIVERRDPTLGILSFVGDPGLKIDSILRNVYRVSFRFRSFDAGCRDFKIKVYVIIRDSLSNFIYGGFATLLNGKTSIMEGGQTTSSITVNTEIKFKELLFWIQGSYFNTDKTKNFSIDELLYFNRGNSLVGTPSFEDVEMVKELVKRKAKL